MGFASYFNFVLLDFIKKNIHNFYNSILFFYFFGVLPDNIADLFLKSVILISFFSFMIWLNFQIISRAFIICNIYLFF